LECSSMQSLIMTILSRSATRAHELSAANASRGRSGHTRRPKWSARRYLEDRKCTLYRLASYYYQRKFDDRHHSMDVPSYCGPIGTAAEDFVAGKRHRGLLAIREFERRVSVKRLANCDMAHTIRYTYVASKTH